MSSSHATPSEGKEEQYLFRCANEDLANRIRSVLRNNKARKEDYDMDLRWVSDREGIFTIGGSEYPCQLLDLPGVVESYKTYNDIHLVKSTDVGQVKRTGFKSSSRHVRCRERGLIIHASIDGRPALGRCIGHLGAGTRHSPCPGT